ncbi:MAG: DUF2070 family protein, partial [Archaeoglobaceae archaeon]|nr:DUF2070 family protein [Archaeoglobaceae archaeon]
FEGRVKCLKFNNFKLISSDFHPGPFRNLGGAKLVNLFDLSDSVYLHSPSTHDRDPVSEEDSIRIRNALKPNGTKLEPMKPFELESENFRLFCIPFNLKRLIFISGKRRLDDFSLDSENFVVDCHNANFFGDLEEKEVEEIKNLVKMAENMSLDPIEDVKGAFVKIKAETESISGYASVVLLDYGFIRYAIVVFDSNNVDPEFREFVERKFGEIGFRAIVCSTDNHSKTGINVKESYKPAGKDKRDFEVLEQLVDICRNVKFESLSFKYAESRVKARVLGSARLEIENLAKKAGKYIYLFFALIFLTFIISIIISKVI